MYIVYTLLLVLYCYLEYTIHEHFLCTQNTLVERFNFDHVAFEEFSCSLRSDFCSIHFTKCCASIACIVPAWCFSNVNFAIFFGIFRSWSNEKHWVMTTLSLTLFIIAIYRATDMFLSSPNRFQMFSSGFPSTRRKHINTGIAKRITLMDSFTNEHSWPKIVQKQTQINFYSSCPFKVEYFMFTFDLQSMFTLVRHFINGHNWHAWCFSNVNSVIV